MAMLLLHALMVVACENDSTSPPSSYEDAPLIRNLIVDFDRHDPLTGRAGPFVFDPSKDKVFFEFNAAVPTPEGLKLLPTFEYRLSPEANVYAPADGYVTHFRYQAETGDYEIGITRSPNLTSSRTGMIMVDHIKDITVAQGNFVTAGQILGKPGPWIEGISRTELMVYQNDTAWCPFLFMTDSLKAGFRQKLRHLMADWESFKNDTTLYDEASMPEPGCNDLAGIP
jgi:hypothetical protein